MRNHTVTLTVPAARDEVFACLSDLSNWPMWAAHFCQRIWESTTGWKMISVAGEIFAAIEADENLGVVDFFWGYQADEMSIIPLRIVSLPHGCAVTLTCFETAHVPGEVFEAIVRALTADLRALQGRFGEGSLNNSLSAGFSPGLVTGKFYETWDFYTAVLGFKTILESDAFLRLQHSTGTILNILRHEMDGPPSELIASTDGRGFWLSLEVPDADEEYRRLVAMGIEPSEEPQDRVWGERMFFVRDPNGVLVSIWHPLPHATSEEQACRLIGA
ncbi:MAG TPA: VOC family protein [Opitutaceae bacterium]